MSASSVPYTSSHAPRSLEVCAGAGGQALGLEDAGFVLTAAVEIEEIACRTLETNRPGWDIRNLDLHGFSGKPFSGIDLLAGGVPCPPFSVAGNQLGANDERDLFPEVLRLAREARPRAIMVENVKGLLTKRFAPYRQSILQALEELGYRGEWNLLYASDFGLPQLRPRSVLVALEADDWPRFAWPTASAERMTVGELLAEDMGSRGWRGAQRWAARASDIGPTIVGGSRKHGGPDLGPTRARQGWADLGVDGRGLANEPPEPEFPVDSMPRLTIEMVARLQGFPREWQFEGMKTARYRQVGNAFPPPVAREVAKAIRRALAGEMYESDSSPQMRLLEKLSA